MTARGSGRVQVALDGEQVGTLSFHSESWAAEGIAGLSQTAVFSFGSDGTDGRLTPRAAMLTAKVLPR